MLKVLATDNLSPVGLEVLENADGIDVDVKPTMDKATLLTEIAGYEAIIIRSATKLTADVLDAAPKLRLAIRAGVGVDNVDVDHATERGILVANTPHGNAATTAEHAMALAVSLARHVPQACASTKDGHWEKKKFTGTELKGKTLGILGIGNIGTHVARIGQGYGMHVIACDPFLTPDMAERLGVTRVEIDDLLARSDVLTLHCPLNDKTRGIIGAEELSRMKPTAILINAARGGIVDEMALARACQEEVIRGAAVDVFEKEPVDPDHPLLQLPNVIVTPHLGASTKEAQTSVAVEASELILEFARTGAVSSAINSQIRLGNVSPLTKSTVELVRRLGTLQAQLVEGEPRKLSVEIFGADNHGQRELLLLSAAQTFLQVLCPLERINVVNVTGFARRRDIELVGSVVATSNQEGYDNWVRVSVSSIGANGEVRVHTAMGSVFATSTLKITEIDGYGLDLAPEGILLLTEHEDRPGVIGSIGTLMGRHDVNISRMAVTLAQGKKPALGVIGVDAPVPDEVLTEMEKTDAIHRVRQVRL